MNRILPAEGHVRGTTGTHPGACGANASVHVCGRDFGDAAGHDVDFTDEHHRAATKIQARAKGKRQRELTDALKKQGVLPGQQRREAEELEDYDYEKEAMEKAMTTAAMKIQTRARGMQERRRVEELKKKGSLPGQPRLMVLEEKKQEDATILIQRRARGLMSRKKVQAQMDRGELPGQQRPEEQAKINAKREAKLRQEEEQRAKEAAAARKEEEKKLRAERERQKERERVWREAEDARQRMEDLAAQIAKDEAEQKARAAEKRRLKEEEMAKRRESMSCSASVSSSELSSEKQQSRRASAMQHMLHSTGASPMTTSGSFAHLGTAFNNGEASEGWDLLMVEESHSQEFEMFDLPKRAYRRNLKDPNAPWISSSLDKLQVSPLRVRLSSPAVLDNPAGDPGGGSPDVRRSAGSSASSPPRSPSLRPVTADAPLGGGSKVRARSPTWSRRGSPKRDRVRPHSSLGTSSSGRKTSLPGSTSRSSLMGSVSSRPQSRGELGRRPGTGSSTLLLDRPGTSPASLGRESTTWVMSVTSPERQKKIDFCASRAEEISKVRAMQDRKRQEFVSATQKRKTEEAAKALKAQQREEEIRARQERASLLNQLQMEQLMSATKSAEQTAKILSKPMKKNPAAVVGAFGGKINPHHNAAEDQPAYLSLPFKKRGLSLTSVLGLQSRGGFM